MNSKLKTILLILGFAALIALSYFAYNRLAVKSGAELTHTHPNGDVHAGETHIEDETQTTTETPTTETADVPKDKPVANLAPDFTVYDIDGNEVKLSDFKGKPTVINFWASWCSPCKQEMPDFDKVYLELGEDVNFVMIDLVDGSRETTEIGKKFIEESGYQFPVYFDSEQNAAIAYGIRSIPTTIFVDSEGHLVTGRQGVISEAKLREGIELAKAA